MKKIILILLMITTKVSFGQLINGGFELWDTTFTGTYAPQLVSLFNVPNPKSGVINHWVISSPYGATQTTDSYSGNYSLILHNWYNYAKEWITYHQPLSNRPKYLQGYFKYITGGANGISHGEANVTLTRFNGISNDTIATGTFQFDSTVSFTPFQINLNYLSALNPDSITIYIINAKGNAQGNVVCHLLYLDNLALSNTSLGIDNAHSSEGLINVYPNPVVNKLTIQNNLNQSFQFSLYNSLGEKIIDNVLTEKISSIDLSDCANGIYFYKLISDKEIIKVGKIIKQ